MDELLSMTEKLTAELKKIGLTLNTEKTKILRCNPEPDKAAIGFAELDDNFVMAFDDNESHRYLGKKLSISGTDRNLIEFKSRKQIDGWHLASISKSYCIVIFHYNYD